MTDMIMTSFLLAESVSAVQIISTNLMNRHDFSPHTNISSAFASLNKKTHAPIPAAHAHPIVRVPPHSPVKCGYSSELFHSPLSPSAGCPPPRAPPCQFSGLLPSHVRVHGPIFIAPPKPGFAASDLHSAAASVASCHNRTHGSLMDNRTHSHDRCHSVHSVSLPQAYF